MVTLAPRAFKASPTEAPICPRPMMVICTGMESSQNDFARVL
jgi:hypothetical protein